MTELIGDPCEPSSFVLPAMSTTEADTISGSTLISGMMIYNYTLSGVEVWSGKDWKTLSSTAR